MTDILELEDRRFPAFAIERDGKVVAKAIIFLRHYPYHQRPVLELLEIFVHPVHRQKGLARSLVKEVVEFAAKENCLAVHLVTADRKIASSLYAQEGFKEHELARNYVLALDNKITKE